MENIMSKFKTLLLEIEELEFLISVCKDIADSALGEGNLAEGEIAYRELEKAQQAREELRARTGY